MLRDIETERGKEIEVWRVGGGGRKDRGKERMCLRAREKIVPKFLDHKHSPDHYSQIL